MLQIRSRLCHLRHKNGLKSPPAANAVVPPPAAGSEYPRNGVSIARMQNTNPEIKYSLALIISVLLSAGCASTPAERDVDAEVFAAEVDRRLDSDPNKRTCRTIRPTGSRLGERICKSNAQWASIEAQSREAIGAIQRDQNVSGGGAD